MELTFKEFIEKYGLPKNKYNHIFDYQSNCFDLSEEDIFRAVRGLYRRRRPIILTSTPNGNKGYFFTVMDEKSFNSNTNIKERSN